MDRKKKRLLLSLLIIALVGGGAVAGTFAFFTARRTVTQSRFATGTLDLNVSSNGQSLQPFVIENIGENGTISGEKTWTVKNTGTLPGKLLVRLQNVSNLENGCNDQEKAVETNCEADTEGEMGGVVNLNLTLNGEQKVASTLATAQAGKVGNDWNALTPIVVPPGGEVTVGANWNTPETAYGNEIQSDSVSFDLDFRLVQLTNGPTPTN